MLANWITLSRLPLLFAGLALLYLAPPAGQLAAVVLLFVGLMLDTVDGVVARRRGITSLIGSVLDIAADRTYELALWTSLADLGLVPVALPLAVVARTALTDALRSVGVAQGTPPLEQSRGRIARIVVSSPVMRIAYSAGKVVSFCGFALARALGGFPAGSSLALAGAAMLAPLRVIAWLTVGLCVLRGLPVIVGALRDFWSPLRLEPLRLRR
jgi:CDP-diacylglycerol---glycerol-3-phosphate 3-phosphatidyltransferase